MRAEKLMAKQQKPPEQEILGKAKRSHFHGIEGATSLKAELIGSFPNLCEAAAFRRARQKVRDELGGAHGIFEELVFSGFVDPDTNSLKVVEKPFNVFAHIATEGLKQPDMAKEQAALGQYQDRFKICANRAENDMHWDSSEPLWIHKASMARRHRFLTTKNLHWQWFNALVFGMVDIAEMGVPIHQALEEVKAMKAAALLYAKNVGGWSNNVGLFVNVFGHNSVNSLFVHVLDMAKTGPAFKELSFKNLPLDEVVKVLEEEAATCKKITDKELASRMSVLRKQPSFTKSRRFFFAGTDGATSAKAELIGRVPVLRDAAAYREARRIVDAELGGVRTIWEELNHMGWVDIDTNLLTTNDKPFNVFARVAGGVMSQPNMESEQEGLGEFKDRYMICKNRPENDEHWDSEDPEWLGKASMSLRHRFLTTKNLHWSWFNALTFGREDQHKGGSSLAEAVAEVQAMKAACLAYAANTPGWSADVGMFVHVFGHNSVNSLHVHIIDMSVTGPTFDKYRYKNCPLDAVLKVLMEELAASEKGNGETERHISVVESAAAAAEAAKQAAEAVVSLRRPSLVSHNPRLSNLTAAEDVRSDILELNVGGKLLMSVSRATLLLAPKESLLHLMFNDSWNSPPLLSDGNGRIFLDYPAKAFERIVDHLRLLRLAPPSKLVNPPNVSSLELQEFMALSNILGIDGFLMKSARYGMNQSDISTLVETCNPSSSIKCCPWGMHTEI